MNRIINFFSPYEKTYVSRFTDPKYNNVYTDTENNKYKIYPVKVNTGGLGRNTANLYDSAEYKSTNIKPNIDDYKLLTNNNNNYINYDKFTKQFPIYTPPRDKEGEKKVRE